MNPPISAPSIWVPKIRSPVSASTTENVAGEPLEIASTTARPSGSVPNSTERTLTTSSAGPRSVREAATSADGPDGAGAAGAGPPRAGPAGAGSARAGLVNVAAAAGAVSAAIPPPSSSAGGAWVLIGHRRLLVRGGRSGQVPEAAVGGRGPGGDPPRPPRSPGGLWRLQATTATSPPVR